MIHFFDEHRQVHGVEPICKVLPIAPSTYYARLAARHDPSKLSARAKRDVVLKLEIERVFKANRKVYPYLLGKLNINRPGQVWCTDITYIPMRKGFLYLVAVMDWYSRKVLSWRLSNTMEVEFCTEALKEALAKYGAPEIFNTDQGSQFTSHDFTKVLKDADVKISMDGKGRWIDNRMIERLWRSLKYECVYLRAFETGQQAKLDIGEWITYYNTERPHSAHGILTPNETYDMKTQPEKLAA